MTNTPPIVNTPHSYDGLGRLYDLYWRTLCARLTPAIDRLALGSLPRGAKVLDLCCGTGHLGGVMCRRGLKVTGLDASEDMVRFARKNAPEAALIIADARRLPITDSFAAVVSTGDSMNHMLTSDDLRTVFASVWSALVPGGTFVFDMNMAKAFDTEWRKSSTVVTADHLLYVRGRFDRAARVGFTEITMFDRGQSWSRRDLRIFQRCYLAADVRVLLAEAGFTGVRAYSAGSLGVRGRLAVGRTFFRARRPAQSTTAGYQ